MRIQRAMGIQRGTNAGFTLAEAAVTIALVAVTLTVLLQSLEGSKLLAAHTRDQKIAKELALAHLAEIEAGLWQDELEFTRSGSYAEQGHGTFWWELAIGDESFTDDSDRDDYDKPFDNWAHRDEIERDKASESSSDTEEEEEATEPFEKVRIRVTFTRYQEFSNDIEFERWIRWEQVYGEDEEEEGGSASPAGGPGGSKGGEGGGE